MVAPRRGIGRFYFDNVEGQLKDIGTNKGRNKPELDRRRTTKG